MKGGKRNGGQGDLGPRGQQEGIICGLDVETQHLRPMTRQLCMTNQLSNLTNANTRTAAWALHCCTPATAKLQDSPHDATLLHTLLQ